MKLRKLQELDQYNAYLHNRIYEIMAVEASEIPKGERSSLKDKLEHKILENRNFFRAGYEEIVELFNRTFCPTLRTSDQRILFLAVQARELIPTFFGQSRQDDVDTWIEERIQKATDICVSSKDLTPMVITYPALCPYKPMSMRPKIDPEHLEQVKQLQREIARLRATLTEVDQIQKKLAENRRVFTALGTVYQRELIDIIRY